MINKNKKAISPVVSTALLLVVAVVIVVGFQMWFNNYNAQNVTDYTLKNVSLVQDTIEDCNGVYYEDQIVCDVKTCVELNSKIYCSVSEKIFRLRSE